jgi:predicted dehydrogenase
MTEPIGVGLIGANPDHSWAAFSHIPALQALPEFELRALATSRAESAAKAEEAYGVKTYVGHEGVLEHPGVDLVVVAVRTPSHRHVLLDVLAARKDVYCEWPLGNGHTEAAELKAAADRAGVRTFIGLQARSSPPLLHMRELIANGYVGRVLSTSVIGSCWVYGGTVSGNNAYQLKKDAGASMLTIQLGHATDALAFVLGEEFRHVVASAQTLWPHVSLEGTDELLDTEVPDHITVSGSLESGASASIHVKGGRSRSVNLQWLVTGTEGELLLDGTGIHLSTDDAGPPRLLGAHGDQAELKPLATPGEFIWVPDSVRGTIAQNIAQHYELVAADLASGSQQAPDFEYAVRRQAAIEQIDRAILDGDRQTISAEARV